MTKKRKNFEKVASALLGSNVRACVNGPDAVRPGFPVFYGQQKTRIIHSRKKTQ